MLRLYLQIPIPPPHLFTSFYSVHPTPQHATYSVLLVNCIHFLLPLLSPPSSEWCLSRKYFVQ
uniref:Uncharacterized protein n=1 Tax=Anguilla anguilla TaxID=7936 RepID=A0A0E9RQL1_ANGAN